MDAGFSLAGMFTQCHQALVPDAPAAVRALAAGAASRDPAATRMERPDPRRLLVDGERVHRAARRHGQAVGLLVLQLPDLPELTVLFGPRAAAMAIGAIMACLGRVAGKQGLAVRVRGDTFALLVPGATGGQLQESLQERMGKACVVELDPDADEILLVPDIQHRTVAAGETVHEAFAMMCRIMERERQLEARHRDRRQREREALPGSIELPRPKQPEPAALVRDAVPRAYPVFPATVPVPLA